MSDYYGECRVNTWYWVYQCQQKWRPFDPFNDGPALSEAMIREVALRLVDRLFKSGFNEMD